MFNEIIGASAPEGLIWTVGISGGVLFLLLILAIALNKFYRKVSPDLAIIRTGVGGVKTASGGGMFIIPLAHQADIMDLSVKRIEIKRHGKEGLICMDNIRADIEVAFYLRISENNIENVAKKLGAQRASDTAALVELFDAQFS